MATLLQEILTNNHEFLANNKCTKEISKYPQKKFALLTCMDTRLVELINKALGIHRGDAKIIQNAGTSLIGEMGETVKSLLLTIYVFDIKEIFIVGHYDCGVALTSSKDILHNMRSRGVSEQQLKLIEKDFQVWLDPYTDPAKNVLTVIKNLRQILLFPMIYLSTDLSLTPIRVNLIFWQMAIKRFKTNRALCFLASSNF